MSGKEANSYYNHVSLSSGEKVCRSSSIRNLPEENT